ncbi:hypothetical protein LCGC14_1318620 [marine sediment metagenome]|uniref:ATP-grasp domain-containing protein n=1 Tax=marine sediment metagenome TaxID=412755 RepID=A0A0F9KK56_9ZZZZ
MEENSIYSPIYHSNDKPDKFPVVLRTSLSLSGGRGISVVKNIDEFNERFTRWWTPYISTRFELRVHILGEYIVKIFKKELNDENDSSTIIMNNENCHYCLRRIGAYPKLDNIISSLHSLDEFNGKFYSLDIGWDSKKKIYFIFEANSASGLNDNSSKLYAEYLVREMNL